MTARQCNRQHGNARRSITYHIIGTKGRVKGVFDDSALFPRGPCHGQQSGWRLPFYAVLPKVVVAYCLHSGRTKSNASRL